MHNARHLYLKGAEYMANLGQATLQLQQCQQTVLNSNNITGFLLLDPHLHRIAVVAEEECKPRHEHHPHRVQALAYRSLQ